mgnify:CR=1 FL=1
MGICLVLAICLQYHYTNVRCKINLKTNVNLYENFEIMGFPIPSFSIFFFCLIFYLSLNIIRISKVRIFALTLLWLLMIHIHPVDGLIGNLFFKKDVIDPGVPMETSIINSEIILNSFNAMGCTAFSPGEFDFAGGLNHLLELEKNAEQLLSEALINQTIKIRRIGVKVTDLTEIIGQSNITNYF